MDDQLSIGLLHLMWLQSIKP